MSTQLTYRPDIDGLRAIAVLLVIGFHAFPNLVPGGYVGVDVFFVISGFLITGLLLQDLEKKQFSFATFYGRRIRRIFPALIPVLAACFAVGWLILPPSVFKSLGLNIFGGAAFSSNLVLLHETGYFDIDVEQKPLLHLWSLGIEEQFYIVWPVLLLLTFSRRLSIAILAVVLFIISFAWNVRIAGSAADFYLPFTRAWELMIGGTIAALGSQNVKLKLDRAEDLFHSALNLTPRRESAFLSGLDLRAGMGIGLIIAAVIAGWSNSGSFPGWWALLPTLGTTLIILSDGSWLNRSVLSNQTVVLVGLMSYPLYLWHWPLLSFTNIITTQPSWQLRVAVILGATVLAWLTYRWIEQPVRKGSYFPVKVAILCIAMALIGSAGFAAYYWQGVPYRVPPQMRDIVDIHLDPQFEHAEWRRDTCFFDVGPSRYSPDCIERGKRPLVFLWGDSMSTSLYPGLKRLQGSIDFGLAQYTRGACPPSLSYGVQALPDCAASNEMVFASLTEARPDIVLLHATWEYYRIIPELRDLIERLRQLNIPRIVVMGPPAGWTGGLPSAAYRYYMLHFYLRDPTRQLIPVRSNFGVNEKWYAYQKQFRDQVLSWGVEYISAWDAMCNGDKCLTRLGDGAKDLVAFDYAHLTVAGAAYLSRAIAPCLFPEQIDRISVPEEVNRSVVCYSPGTTAGSSLSPAKIR